MPLCYTWLAACRSNTASASAGVRLVEMECVGSSANQICASLTAELNCRAYASRDAKIETNTVRQGTSRVQTHSSAKRYRSMEPNPCTVSIRNSVLFALEKATTSGNTERSVSGRLRRWKAASSRRSGNPCRSLLRDACLALCTTTSNPPKDPSSLMPIHKALYRSGIRYLELH